MNSVEAKAKLLDTVKYPDKVVDTAFFAAANPSMEETPKKGAKTKKNPARSEAEQAQKLDEVV